MGAAPGVLLSFMGNRDVLSVGGNTGDGVNEDAGGWAVAVVVRPQGGVSEMGAKCVFFEWWF